MFETQARSRRHQAQRAGGDDDDDIRARDGRQQFWNVGGPALSGFMQPSCSRRRPSSARGSSTFPGGKHTWHEKTGSHMSRLYGKADAELRGRPGRTRLRHEIEL